MSYEVRANCSNIACSTHSFTVKRKQVVKQSTCGQQYTTSRVVCPSCRMWAAVTSIKEKRS